MSEWLQNIYYWFWPETQKQEDVTESAPVQEVIKHPEIITRPTLGYRMSYKDVCMIQPKLKLNSSN